MFKSSLRMIKTLILLCIFLTLTLAYIFETQGLPQNLLYSIKKTLYVDGLKFDCSEVQLGPINGLRIADVRLFDSQEQEQILISADEVKLGYNRKKLLEDRLFLVDAIQIKNANLNLTIETKKEQDSLALTQSHLDLFLREDVLKVNKFTAKWQNINLDFTGEIPGIDSIFTRDRTQIDSEDLSFSVVSAKFLNEKLPEDIKQNLLDILQGLDSLNSFGEIYCEVKFYIPVESPQDLELELRISIPEFLYQGLHCKNAELNLALKRNGVIDITSLKTRIDENEFIGGRLLIDLANDTAQGYFDSRFLPDRVIKALMPKASKELDFLEFTEAPNLNFEIICKDLSELIRTQDPRKIEIRNGKLSVRKLKYNGLLLNNMTSKLELKELKISLKDIEASSDQLSGKFNLFVDPEQYFVILTGDFIGDPQALHYFPIQEQGRKTLKSIWKDFKWHPLSPVQFSGTYMNSFDPKDPTGANLNLFQGEIKANNAQYRSLKSNTMSTKIYVTDDYVYLDDLKLTLANKDHATLNLAINPLRNNSYVNVESQDATLPIKPMLELFQKGLSDSLSPVTFHNPAKISTFNAVFPVSPGPDKHNYLICEAQFPKISFLDHDFYNSEAEVSLFKDFLDIQISKSQAYKGQVKGHISSNLTTKPFKVDLEFKDLNLTSLTNKLSSESTQVAGKLSGLTSLEITPPTEHRQYNLLNGTGSLQVKNGAFFSVPILSPMIERVNKVIPFGNTSEITELHTELKFQGDKIFIPQLVTNGKIIAFSSTGYYDWKEEYLKFNINTHYLQKLFSLPEPFDFDPISSILSNTTGFMNSEIKGNIDNPKWKFKVTGNIKGFLKNIRNTVLPFLKKDNEENLQDLIEN